MFFYVQILSIESINGTTQGVSGTFKIGYQSTYSAHQFSLNDPVATYESEINLLMGSYVKVKMYPLLNHGTMIIVTFDKLLGNVDELFIDSEGLTATSLDISIRTLVNGNIYELKLMSFLFQCRILIA